MVTYLFVSKKMKKWPAAVIAGVLGTAVAVSPSMMDINFESPLF